MSKYIVVEHEMLVDYCKNFNDYIKNKVKDKDKFKIETEIKYGFVLVKFKTKYTTDVDYQDYLILEELLTAGVIKEAE